MKLANMKLATMLLVIFVVATSPFVSVLAQVLPDSVGTRIALEATQTSGPTLLDKMAQLVAALSPIIALLSGLGIIQKYAPFLAKLPNFLIPYINSLVAFLLMFAPAQAHASFFGDLVHGLSFPAKAAGSLFLGGLSHLVYEAYLRGIFEKIGWTPAGLTSAQKVAKLKLLNLAV